MRKLLLYILLCLIPAVHAQVDADLTGNLQLKGRSKSSNTFLDLLKCGLESIPKNFLRKEKIEANYSGANTVTLETESYDGEKIHFRFRVPSIMKLTNVSKTKRNLVKFGTASVECVGEDKDPENSGSLGDNFSGSTGKSFKKHKLSARKNSRTKKQRLLNKQTKFLNGTSSSGLLFSIQKMVAVRKGDKGKVTGTFIRKADKARGRFAVKFDYKETEN